MGPEEQTRPDPALEEGEELAAPTATLDRRRSLIGGLVALAFLVVVFWRVIPQFGDYAGAFETIAALGAADLALLLGALLLYLGLYGLPYLAAAPGLSFGNSEIVNNSRFAIGNGIPGGGALSVGVGYLQLVFYGQRPTAATAAIGATGVWSMFVTLTLPITGVAALFLIGNSTRAYLASGILGVAVLALVVGAFGVVLRSERGARRVGRWGDALVGGLVRRFRPGAAVDVTGSVLRLRHDVVGLVGRRWLPITAANFGVSLGQFLILATALRLVAGPEYQVLAVYGAWAISQLGILLPLTPGGLGTVDAALIALLVANGVSQADATAAALLWRATYYLPQILLGVACILLWRWQVGRRSRIGVSGSAA